MQTLEQQLFQRFLGLLHAAGFSLRLEVRGLRISGLAAGSKSPRRRFRA
jgi:hypothetical protein